ncbi:MAG: LicD family protein [Carnobacterium sp.]|uniref:LicD family protein n=1 Tax=Carnobacterium sp. TaxID=48221 RepID=UPI003C75BE43
MQENELKFPGLNIKIKEAQEVQLEILLEFDRLCKKYGIQYQLFSGTLIGAIRHNGFIPWDDDIDVCMLREEYNRFLEVSIKELNKNYFLQNYHTDKNFQSQYSKIRKNHTRYVENLVQDVNMHQGIFIDVFPYDHVRPKTLKGKAQRIAIDQLKLINYCRVMRVNDVEKNRVLRIAKKATYYILKVIPKSKMDRLITKLVCLFNNKEEKYVGELSISTSKHMYDSFVLKKEFFYDSIDWDFEGYKFPVPRAYDEILTKNYGNYMEMPPLNEQEPHHGIIEIKLA